MTKTTFTLKAITEGEKLNLSVSFPVYNRMITHLRRYKNVFNIITNEEYVGNGTEKDALPVLNRNVTLQFASSKSYYKMVENLINSIDKTTIDKNG